MKKRHQETPPKTGKKKRNKTNKKKENMWEIEKKKKYQETLLPLDHPKPKAHVSSGKKRNKTKKENT